MLIYPNPDADNKTPDSRPHETIQKPVVEAPIALAAASWDVVDAWSLSNS